jgi:hypothetical protein
VSITPPSWPSPPPHLFLAPASNDAWTATPRRLNWSQATREKNRAYVSPVQFQLILAFRGELMMDADPCIGPTVQTNTYLISAIRW